MLDSPSSLPTALAALLTRGLLPHASLFVGGSTEQQQAVTEAVCQALACAPADRLIVNEPPKIEELRSIIGQVHLKPFQSKLALLAFHQFDRFSEECANVLLKTLEEPPAHARIIVYASHDGDILRTILSRVARFRLPTRRIEQTMDLPGANLPLKEQFAWSKNWATSEKTTQAALGALVSSVRSPDTASRLLAYAANIGNYPVNARLALDTALVIRKYSK